MKIKYIVKFFTLVCLMLSFTGLQYASAQKADKDDNDNGTVVPSLTPHSKDGVFSSTASYTLDLNSTYDKQQVGKVSCLVTTETGKKVKFDTTKVKLSSHGSGSYNFDIPGLQPGFYKVSFMVNLSDYDDTLKVAFGIKPEQIISKYQKPADFDSFWANARAELAAVKPEYKVTEMPDSSRDGRRVFLVEMKSIGGLTVRGWLTEPKAVDKHKKFAVLLGLPGYQVALKPMYGTDPDMAIFTLNIRGSGNSKDVIDVRRETYITLNIEDKNKYILKGAIMDCVRAVDFLYSRPEIRHDNIIAAGGSLGGFLAVATSGVDKRINFCSAANPILSDVRNLTNEVDWPFIDIKKYVDTRPGLTFEKVLSNLDYFDAKNFATGLKAPTLVGMGLVDNIAPPNTVYTLYNNIPSQKHLIIFRDLGHEIGKKFVVYEGRWMRDTFALF